MTDDSDPPNGGDDEWYGEADPRVPDAPDWPDRDLGFLGDDVFLGEEAVTPAGPGGDRTMGPPRPHPAAPARWEWLFEFLYSKWFRVEASGLSNIPDKGRALLVANHAGTLPY